jgi:thioredoxin reductase
MSHYDVVIVGAGPAGLSAALQLGRGRKRVLLVDAGARRNAAAVHVHGFLTRDGIEPAEMRRQGRADLAAYPNVEIRDEAFLGLTGQQGDFAVQLASGGVKAERVLLCTGLVDVLPEIDGFRAQWGRSIFQCPYCHGWEVQDRRFGFLAPSVETLEFALLLRGWSRDLVVFTHAAFAVPAEVRTRLAAAHVRLEERQLTRVGPGKIEVEGGEHPVEILFAHPPQRQVPVVAALGLDVLPNGYLRVDERGQTSRPGVYAAGDLTTHLQAAVLAAAAGMAVAAGLNYGLSAEQAIAGRL